MPSPPKNRARTYGVFLSHSSADGALAGRMEKALEKDGLSVWLDRSEIRVGTLLRAELHKNIRASRVVVILWSKAAAASRWVAAEILTAFHEKRFIVPCVLDATPLPYFLENATFLDLQTRPQVPRDLRRPSARCRAGPTRCRRSATAPVSSCAWRSPRCRAASGG